ncbi:acyl-CoA/acyl-ACP dehydrogenase [Planotetraspora sp. A-T 1434]|uniref:acyl-CoA dehydrogenase family protein n=1 Tax=Planotetraspora sp. A-T 1434 TaxID=2979219 RepID=UPI0021BFE354|nr:acyl-CoA dehydrogenase family protein [Planotetraspora sp. A-T 1434]MCT9933976.1 acyl-CoA/acyl-ACP dehydrogenase [Planotetraspora sp. A-T 1434]
MKFAFTDDQLALASTVRQVLAAHCPAAAVRQAGKAAPAAERLPAWPQLAEIGFFGMLVPEPHDGLGLGLADAILAFEETGRAALPGPVVETAAVAPGLLGDDDLLVRLAEGRLRVSVRLGDQVYAPDADLADLLVVERHGELRAVPAGSVRLTPQAGVDPVRRLFSVAFGSPEAVDGGKPQLGRRLDVSAVHALRTATVAVAAQLVGLARHLLETSVEYAKSRRQFGAPIGSFQAVKHQLADVAIAVDFAAPLVYAAALAVDRAGRTAPAGGVDSAGPTVAVGEVDRAVSAAKAAAGEAATRAARVALQVHGAIGYTGELDLRLWLARVWSLASAYGDTGVHRSRLRAAILGTPDLTRWP